MSNNLEILPYTSPAEETLNYEDVKHLVGQSSPVRPGHDEVSLSDIRHWCEVMQDANPLYADTEYARNSEYGGPIAPPAMVQAFAIETFKVAIEHFREKKLLFPEDPHNLVDELLVKYGYTGIMATEQKQEFYEPLRPGDVLYSSIKVASLSDYDHITRQGVGRYLTFLYTFTNQDNKLIAKEYFTMLFYRAPISSRRRFKG